VATIYFTVQFCVATNRERRLLNSVLSVKSFVIERALRKASFIRLTKNCNVVAWFWSQPFQLDQPPLHASKNAKLPWTACILVPIVYTLLILSFETRGLFMCACATRILAAASIRERQLFRSAHPEVRRQFESGIWSSKYGNHCISLKKGRPRCYAKSPSAQDMFWPIPGLISCAGVTRWWGPDDGDRYSCIKCSHVAGLIHSV